MQLLCYGITLKTAAHCYFRPTFLRMQTLFFLLLFACMQTKASDHPQTINLSLKDATLEKVFAEIRKQTHYRFIYTKEELANAVPITVDVKNASIEQVLEKCMANQPFTYLIDQDQVIVRFKPMELKRLAEPPLTVTGKITGAKAEPIAGASIQLKGTKRVTVSNADGFFSMDDVDANSILIISSIGYTPVQLKIKDAGPYTIQLSLLVTELDAVKISTGYQELPKERSTGSFEKVNTELLNRSATPGILERLDGVVPGLIFNRRMGTDNKTDISIRGISTINSDQKPLVIVDNFPYAGDINNINPNDVESITVLKDAAAASIWGAKAGNGVIVITTKKSSYGKKTTIQFNHNISFQAKPDLNYFPNFPAADFMEVEKMLFGRGYFNGQLANTFYYPIVSPYVEILSRRRSGLISPADSASAVARLLRNNILDDYDNYLYRTSRSEQHSISFSGGSEAMHFLFSAGYDKILSTQVGNQNDRLTLRTSNAFKPNSKFELQLGAVLTTGKTQNNSPGKFIPTGRGALYPYARLVDENGNPAATTRNYRATFLDTAGNGKLLDWRYRPLEELAIADNTGRLFDLTLNFSTSYNFGKGFSASASYQYEKTYSSTRNNNSIASFITRQTINYFTPRGSSYQNSAVPYGDILDESKLELNAHAFRIGANYNRTINGSHELTGLAGFEINENRTDFVSWRFYGYNEDNLSIVNADFVNSYPTYFGSPSNIENPGRIYSLNNRLVSFYANGAYSFRQRYTLSASARRDASNLFGTATNDKWKPFWSIGAGWIISKESWFNSPGFSFLKLRGSFGYSGNVNNSNPALLTIYANSPNFLNNLPTYAINNPPNPDLRWEKVGIANLGIDFTLANGLLKGSLEYYHKKSTDLISPVPADITSGWGTVYINSAVLKGRGVDLSLNSQLIRRSWFSWETNFLFSYNTNKVAKYLYQPSIRNYISAPITPIEGRNAYSMISYRWAGLDPQNGAARGYHNGVLSKDYNLIIGSPAEEDVRVHGPQRPTVFGALRNTVNVKQFSLSFNISYRFNYFVRRTDALNYYLLYGSSQTGYADYQRRWQHPGDEAHTNVPALMYPANFAADNLYQNAEINITKGDHIRLQDINLAYQLPTPKTKKMGFQALRLYAYANQLGILWKASSLKLDPDYGVPPQRSFSIGIQASFY